MYFVAVALKRRMLIWLKLHGRKLPPSFLPSSFRPLSPAFHSSRFNKKEGLSRKLSLREWAAFFFYILAKKNCERNEKERRKEVLSMTKCCNVTQPNRCSNVLNVQKTWFQLYCLFTAMSSSVKAIAAYFIIIIFKPKIAHRMQGMLNNVLFFHFFILTNFFPVLCHLQFLFLAGMAWVYTVYCTGERLAKVLPSHCENYGQ